MSAIRTSLFCLSTFLVLYSASVALVCAADEKPAGPKWLGSTAGISDRVLPPWAPVKVAPDAAKVTVWGRIYGFDGLPFPASVVARDTEVLASPIVLRGEVGGKQLAWTAGTCRTAEAKPNIVRLATDTKSAGLRCEGTVGIEYDGMIRSDFKLLPEGKKVDVQRLVLEIPIRREHAKYLHFWPGRWGSCFNSQALPGLFIALSVWLDF